MFSAAHDLKMEWVIIKGISDYADGTATLTQHWKPFASVMAASVVNNMLRVPVVFDDWPHYRTHEVRGGTPRGAMNTLSALEVPVSTLFFFENIPILSTFEGTYNSSNFNRLRNNSLGSSLMLFHFRSLKLGIVLFINCKFLCLDGSVAPLLKLR